MVAVKRKTRIKKFIRPTKSEPIPEETKEEAGVVSAETISVVEATVENTSQTEEIKPEVKDAEDEISKEEPKESAEHKIEEENSAEAKFPWKKTFLWTLAVLMLVGAFFGMLYFAFHQGVQVGEQRVRTQILLTPTSVPATPTSVKPDKSAYTIKVLNGSGVAGQAASAQKILVNEGYEVSSIGNSAQSNYDKTIIQAKSSVSEDFLRMLKAFLAETYEMDDNEVLPSTSDSDIVVVIGSKKSPQ